VSARLFDLSVEQYLAEVALPQCSRPRCLDLAPKYWAATRARILAADKRDADVLRDGIRDLVVPAAPSATEEPTSKRSQIHAPLREHAAAAGVLTGPCRTYIFVGAGWSRHLQFQQRAGLRPRR
jgi:hypothetical protein